MAHDLNSTSTIDFGSLAIHSLLPERPALIGEFSPAYEAFLEAAAAEAIALGVDPRLVLSAQLLNNSEYHRHSEKLPDLEKRVRMLSAEYREVQKSRPIDVVPVARD